MDVWGFSQSWPLLLIVIAMGTLIQRVRTRGLDHRLCRPGLPRLGKLDVKIYAIATFLLPLLLILVGINVLMK